MKKCPLNLIEIVFSCSNSTSSPVIKVSPPKSRSSRGRPKKPKIGRVWSYQEEEGEPVPEGHNEMVIKSERQESYQEPPSIDMSRILTDDKLSTQLLTLIDTNVCTDLKVGVNKVPSKEGRGGVYKVCWGRISNSKERGEYHGCGEECILEKRKRGCNIIFLIIFRLLGRISSEKGDVNFGEENQDIKKVGAGKNIKL